MNGQIDQLVRSLLQKDSLEQCSLQELEQFASRHPYFGAAQLLLTKKLQVENSAQYNEQLEKTFLFFHNPLWVQQLLNDNGEATIIIAEPPTELEKTAGSEESGVGSQESGGGSLESGGRSRDKSEFEEQHTENEPEVFKGSFITPFTIEEKNNEVPDPVTIEDNRSLQIETDKTPVITDPVKEELSSTPFEIEHNGSGEVENVTENSPVITEPVKEELLFEPFHTVDYFASQGIRIREEEIPKDKFGKQLKSFTDWLKSMKKLPVTEIAAKTEPVAEKKVEILAQHSLQERVVLTEAMAEVWEKQGNKENAIQIYNKLSLLDPSKSAYFAAKIEALKKLN